jgi:hypothetical protein
VDWKAEFNMDRWLNDDEEELIPKNNVNNVWTISFTCVSVYYLFVCFFCTIYINKVTSKTNVLVVDHFRMIGLCYSLVFRYHR